MDMQEIALQYIMQGLSVLPLLPRDKKPAIKGGLSNATREVNIIIPWYAAHPEHNIGIACGAKSRNLIALDLDVSDTKDGTAVLADFEEKYAELPHTAAVKTGSGGVHYLYLANEHVQSSVNAILGVDIRAEGSYIVAPPSIHPNGNTYEWIHPLSELAEANQAVYDFIKHVQPKNQGDKSENRFKLPDQIKEGERDNTLFKYACQLQEFGATDDEIAQKINEANLQKCSEPLPDSDIARIVKSATKYPKGEKQSLKTHNKPSQDPDYWQKFVLKSGKVKHNVLAREILDKNKACIIDGVPSVWTGQKWAQGIQHIKRLCTYYYDGCRKQDKNEVIAYVLEQSKFYVSKKDLDTKPYIQFKNGTYDPTTRKMVDPTPDMFITNQTAVPFDFSSTKGEADAFIARIAANDKATAKMLRQIIGSAMCSYKPTAQTPMLLGKAQCKGGEASNGKSTYLNALTTLLGFNNVSSLSLSVMGQRFQAAQMVGKLANIGDDIPDKPIKGEELDTFKKIVTSDMLYTDIKGGEGFSFLPHVLAIFSMNSVPEFEDVTGGILRRLAFVPFRAIFRPDNANYDQNYSKVINSPSNLARLAYLGVCEVDELYNTGQFVQIDGAQEEMYDFVTQNNTVLRWIDEDGLTKRDFIGHSSKDVYENYIEWCERIHSLKYLSQAKVSREVCKRFDLKSSPTRLPSGRVAKAFQKR